jgi:hypothetical protein
MERGKGEGKMLILGWKEGNVDVVAGSRKRAG